jgi:hypothetical protein
MTKQEILAEIILAGKGTLTRFLPGFNETNYTRQAEHLPNHLGWTLGHVALYIHEAAGRVDGQSLPETDFGPDIGSDRTRYTAQLIGFGSQPTNDPLRYPTLARGLQVFEAACERLANAVRRADDATLERKIDWMGTPISFAVLAARVMFHAGVHTGQVMDLRRALGLGSALKV